MDIRTVESLVTSGALGDSAYKADASIENISLDWNPTENVLGVVDHNLNYSLLPWNLYDQAVKKVFLTYNGKSAETGDMLETVVMESSSASDLKHIPGYNNSNEWHYNPREFTYRPEVSTLTNPNDYSSYPYDYREGFTVVKQFLTANANVSPGTPAYTAFYRAPQYTSFLPTNVEGNKIYTDGWYTSYVAVTPTWESTSTTPTFGGTAAGDIVYVVDQKEFYINTTGVVGTLITDPSDSTKKIPDDNWAAKPTFEQWQSLMKRNLGTDPGDETALTDDAIYFVETQHLVTVEINEAILKELKKNCTNCHSLDFRSSDIDTYMKLVQKRLGAWIQFNSELYHEASTILETARQACHLCLYHQDECNPIKNKTC